MCVLVIVAYYCVWMFKWCFMDVFIKIHAQRDKLGVVYRLGDAVLSKHCYSRGEKKF